MTRYFIGTFLVLCILSLHRVPVQGAGKNVLFLGVSTGDKKNIEDIKKINDLLLADINKALNGKIQVIDLSGPYAYSQQRDISTIAATNRAGWVLYGSVRFEDAWMARVRLYLYDSTLKKDMLDRDFTTPLRAGESISSNLEYYYSYIAENNNYFAPAAKSVNGPPRIAFIDFNISDDSSRDYRGMKSLLKQHIEKNTGKKLTVIRDEQYPFINMKSEEYRSEKRLAAICEAIKTDWIVTGQVFRNSDIPGHDIIIQLFNAKTSGYQNVIQISSPDYQTAVNLAGKRMENFLLTVSLSAGYALHPRDDMCFVREITYTGITNIDLNYVTPYSVYYRGSETVIGSYGRISLVDNSGRITGKIGTPGPGKEEFQVPMKIAGDGRGSVFVLDTAARKILIYDKAGSLEREIYHNASAAQDFAVSASGNIFIPDIQKSLILVYTREGMHISSIPLEREVPVAITTFSGKPVLVTDCENFYCLIYFSEDGKILKKRMTGISRSMLLLSRCTMDAAENLYGVDVSKNIFFKIDKEDHVQWIIGDAPGSEQRYFNIPYDIAVSPDGERIHVVDMQNRRTLYFTRLNNRRAASSSAAYMSLARKVPTGSSQALYYIAQALALDPRYIPALLARADYYSAVGHFPVAAALYEKVLQLDKKNITAKKGAEKNRVALYSEQARFHEDAFRLALETGPESARPHYEKSVLYYEMALKLAPDQHDLRTGYEAITALFQKSQGTVEIRTPDIQTISLQELFSSTYKFYTDNPLGAVIIHNTTGHTIDRIHAELHVKEYMDFPTDSRPFRNIKPGESVKLDLYAVFSNRVLSITENTPLSARLTILYSIKGKEYSLSRNEPITVFNRNAMTWEDTRRLSSFITTRDTAVKVFARGTAQQFRDQRPGYLNILLQNAIEVFDTLGVHGITYTRDPRTPFTTFSKQKNLVDHIQYPRETLRFKTGDCDDLTVLFCALLENLGIETALVTVPGHIFMMFNTEVPVSKKTDISTDESRFIIYRDSVWIPVETTLMGDSFLSAWDRGIETYTKYSGDKLVDIIAAKDAWQVYAPVTLDDDGWEPPVPGPDKTLRLYNRDITAIVERELGSRVRILEKALQQDSGSAKIYNSIGVTYGRFGRLEKAREYFEQALKIEPDHFSAHNNMGNILYMEGKYDQALVYFEKARSLRPGSPSVHVNLSLVYGKINDAGKSREMMQIALRLDSSLQKQYGSMLDPEGLKAGEESVPGPIWEEK